MAAPIVMDFGSAYYKCGFAGDELPKIVEHSIKGTPRYHSTLISPTTAIGDHAYIKKAFLNLDNIIHNGSILNYTDFTYTLNTILYEQLRIQPNECPIFFVQNPYSSTEEREKISQILFEQFKIPKIGFGVSTLLALYALGEVTGTSVEIGDSITSISPVIDGFTLENYRYHIGGKHITNALKSLLMQRGYYFDTFSKYLLTQSMMEKIASCKKESPTNYILPDGTSIALGKEQKECINVLFDPTQYGLEYKGIPEMVLNSIQSQDIDCISALKSKIVLCGGVSEIDGFPELLGENLNTISNSSCSIMAKKNRRYFGWIGGSVVSSLSTLKNWVTISEYQESGCANEIIKKRVCN